MKAEHKIDPKALLNHLRSESRSGFRYRRCLPPANICRWPRTITPPHCQPSISRPDRNGRGTARPTGISFRHGTTSCGLIVPSSPGQGREGAADRQCPPGTFGAEMGGQLTRPSWARAAGWCVRRIEKAHPSVFDLSASLLGEARLTERIGKRPTSPKHSDSHQQCTRRRREDPGGRERLL